MKREIVPEADWSRTRFACLVDERGRVYLAVPFRFHPVVHDIQLYPVQRTQRVEGFSAHGALTLHRSVNGHDE